MFGLIKKGWEEYDKLFVGLLVQCTVTETFVKNTTFGNVALLLDVFEWQ